MLSLNLGLSMCTAATNTFSKVKNYLDKTFEPDDLQKQDDHLTHSRISVICACVFFTLSIVFLCIAFNPKRSLKVFLSLSGCSTLLAIICSCIRPCMGNPPPLRKAPRPFSPPSPRMSEDGDNNSVIDQAETDSAHVSLDENSDSDVEKDDQTTRNDLADHPQVGETTPPPSAPPQPPNFTTQTEDPE